MREKERERKKIDDIHVVKSQIFALYTEGKVKVPTSETVFILTFCVKSVNSIKRRLN